MQTLTSVFFHMQTSHADPFSNRRPARVERRDLDPPMLRNRLIELRYLVPFRRIRIKIVLPRKDTRLTNLAVDRLRRQHRKLYRPAIQHRQCPRQPQASRANMSIRFAAILVHAATKRLRRSQKLNMDLQPNHRLVLGKDLRRNCSQSLTSALRFYQASCPSRSTCDSAPLRYEKIRTARSTQPTPDERKTSSKDAQLRSRLPALRPHAARPL